MFCTFLNLQAEEDIFEDSLEDILSMESEIKADVGSRSGAKNFLNSPSPIDVITHQQIEHSGLTSLTDILRYFVAGFNAPETSIADGSDHVRAFTLRGMNPDQILVLVNGKRLHSSALMHINGTIGRGSSGVDLDTIAPVSIDKIEILRDGAAAQYGSDAISGVINIILKGAGHSNQVSVHAGKRIEGDGEQLSSELFVSVPLDYDGFVNLSVQAKKQDSTNRSGDKNTKVGIPDAKNILAVVNAEIPLLHGTNIYSNILFNYRDSKASAFYRASDHHTNTPLLYPNGFSPKIDAEILDYSVAIGTNGELVDNIYYDLSNVYGYNSIKYSLSDSMNYFLGASSPTSFNVGSLTTMQNCTNLDLKKDFKDFKLATGIEYRYESYQINSGDEASYIKGGTPKIGGSQGFAGYSQENSTDSSRNSYALYIDGVYDFSSNTSLEGAGRYEDFSDFGYTSNLKLLFAHYLLESVMLRTSVSTGFRAPSLSQSNYSHTSTFGGGVEATFKPDHEVSMALGAEALKPEKSQHFTIGSVYQPTKSTSFTIDYFYTGVNDKIMISNEYTPSAVLQAQYGINKVRFFTNAIDTQTQGIDIKFNTKETLSVSSSVDVSIWYHYSKNKVTNFNTSSINRENSYEQIDRIENGQPKDSIKFLTSYIYRKLETTLNISRYGSYEQVIDNQAYKFNEAWTTDLDIAYKVSKNVGIAIGGNNIFNTLPNKWDGLENSSSHYGYNDVKQYSRYSPFGYSGTYYYARITIKI